MKRIVLTTVIAAASIASAVASAGEKAYVDATGDSKTAPDLTSVDVSDTNGFVVFKITGSLTPGTSYEIYIDADRNQSTGDDGDELWLTVFQEDDGKTYWDADRWDGSRWADGRLDVTSQGFAGRQELGFPAAAAGLNGAFDFRVVSLKMVADAVESFDRAPDSIVPWTYEVTSRAASTAGEVSLGAVQLVPARIVAGKPVTVRVPVRAGDTGQPFAGTASCTARIKGLTIRGTGTTSNGVASCRLLVPRGTTGSTAQGSIVVGSGAQAVTKTFRFRVA